MALVTLPSILGIKRVQWLPHQPAQVNTSEWTGSRQTVQLPGKGRMTGSAEFVPLIGSARIEALRAFLADTEGPFNQFAIPAVEEQQLVSFPSIGNRSTITNRLGTSVSANGRVITRTAPGTGWGAASADSAGIAGGSVVAFRAGAGPSQFVAGLNSDPSADSDWTGIDHGWSIYEINGRNMCRTVTSGSGGPEIDCNHSRDLFSIVYDPAEASVSYYRNGALQLRVAAAAGQTFSFDCSIGTAGGVIADAIHYPMPAITAGVQQIAISSITDGPTAAALRKGWMATALFKGGGAQLVTLTATADRTGTAATATFKPPLRAAPYALILDRPFALVARTGTDSGWSVDPGRVYGAALAFEEAY